MTLEKQGKFYIPELDGLRFIAFLLVFLHHSPYYVYSPIWEKIHEYGWLGVDLFLCLSAFLITKLLVSEFHLYQKIDMRYFFLRRILRIWPIYFIITLIAFGVYWTTNGWQSGMGLHLLGMITFTENIVTASAGYIRIPFLVTLWTISYEEQFYLIIPWLVTWLITRSLKFKLFLLGAILLIGNLTRAFYIIHQAPHPAIWTLPFTHFETILGGTMLALGVLDRPLKNMNARLMLTVSFLCLTCIFFLPNFEVIEWNLILTYTFSGVGFTLLVQTILDGKIMILATILNNRTVVYLGKISYGLYVYHISSQYLTNTIVTFLGVEASQFLAYPILLVAISLPLTILISTLSYVIIEKPFLKLKERYTLVRSRPI